MKHQKVLSNKTPETLSNETPTSNVKPEAMFYEPGLERIVK